MAGKAPVFLAGCLTGFLTPLILLGIAVAIMVGPMKGTLVDNLGGRLSAPPISAGEQADYNWKAQTEGGDAVDPADWAGKPAFISFWDPSCTPCLAELPGMENLYQQAQGLDMTFAAVAIDNQDDAFAYMAEQAFQFPTYALDGELPEVFKTKNKPATFIVGKDGVIKEQHVGAALWDDPSVLALLQDLCSSAIPVESN